MFDQSIASDCEQITTYRSLSELKSLKKEKVEKEVKKLDEIYYLISFYLI